MRDPAKEMGVRRRQLYANRGESLQGSEEGVFCVGSQQCQDHGCKPGPEGGWEKGGDTEEERLTGDRVCWREGEAGTFHLETLTRISPIPSCSGAVDPTVWTQDQQHQEPLGTGPEGSLRICRVGSHSV